MRVPVRRVDDEQRAVVVLPKGRAGLAVRELPESWLRQYDPELVAFTNANRPDEWQAAQALLRDESVAVEDQD